MANKNLVKESPHLTLEQKAMGLIACIAQEQKVEIDRLLKEIPLSMLQLSILHSLSEAPDKGLTVNQLKAALVDENPNVSRTLNKLAAAGLVRKVRSTEDQRVVHVLITPSGEKIHLDADQRLARVSLGLSKTDVTRLYEILAKVGE